MTEDTIIVEEKEEEENAEETVTEQVKTDKTFTQEDVDKIVKGRLAREKGLTSKARDEFDEYKISTEAIIKEYEESIQKEIENLSEHQPENIKDILGKLEPRDQLTWLTDPKNQIKNRKSPGTPEQDADTIANAPERRRRLL